MRKDDMLKEFIGRWGEARGKWINRKCKLEGETGVCPELLDAWRKAKSLEGWLSAIKPLEPTCFVSETWVEVGKLEGWRVPVTADIERHIVCADAGGVTIADKAATLTINIPNGCGDGFHPVYVVDESDRGKINLSMLDFVTTVRGEFVIAVYDCRQPKDIPEYACAELSGWYGIYRHDGVVAFSRWGDK